VTTSQRVLEVATICVHTGLNPVRHILESPCQYVRDIALARFDAA
jgi:hypothetical protein